MVNEWQKYYNIVEELQTKRRFAHTLRTVEMASTLSEHYNLPKNDQDKVRLAALLHDITKENNQLELVDKYQLKVEAQKYNGQLQLYHSLTGMAKAKELGILDEEVLVAIKAHTIGNEDPSIITKIIYMADAIEVGREYSGVEKLRELAFIDLDQGIIQEVNMKIKYLLEREMVINTVTIEMRNNLLLSKKKARK